MKDASFFAPDFKQEMEQAAIDLSVRSKLLSLTQMERQLLLN